MAIKKEPDGSLMCTHGGDDRIRTCDILLAKQALYQLSYIPRFIFPEES
jgi:hypothetical protein